MDLPGEFEARAIVYIADDDGIHDVPLTVRGLGVALGR